MRIRIALLLVGALLLALAGFNPASPPAAAADSEPEASPPLKDFAAIARGKKLYERYCAQCHGRQAEGAPDWRGYDAQGKLKPPPLNGAGHSWHHPKDMLRRQIREGGPSDLSTMPPFGDKLSDRQIDDIIAWFQALWPEEIYRAWYKMDQRRRADAEGQP